MFCGFNTVIHLTDCPENRWGPGCDNHCNCLGPCDSVTGNCTTGCVPGKMGNTCQEGGHGYMNRVNVFVKYFLKPVVNMTYHLCAWSYPMSNIWPKCYLNRLSKYPLGVELCQPLQLLGALRSYHWKMYQQWMHRRQKRHILWRR